MSSITSSGPLSVPLIQSPNLTADHLYTDRLTSSTTDIPNISIPPPAFYQLASPTTPQHSLCLDTEDSTEPTGAYPQTHSETVQESPGETPFSRPPIPFVPGTLSRTPSSRAEGHDSEDVLSLSMRLGRALLRVGLRTIEQLTNYIDSATSSEDKQQQRANLQVMLCLLLLLITGIFLMTRSGSLPPRWEFYLPPPDL